MQYKEFDKEMFENLCSVLCTAEEICQIFSTTKTTLFGWVKRTYGQPFSTVYNAHAGKGKSSLRRMQLKLAQNNAQMAIWLGKQWLSQVDRREEVLTQGGNTQSPMKLEIVIQDETDEKRHKKVEQEVIDGIKSSEGL
jgi:hypothetical protein